MVKRSKTAVVQTGLRIREPLRIHLEKAAKDRGVSLNTEINDRLERSMEHFGLLPEILTLAYGERWARFFVEAHKNGLLRLRHGDKEKLIARATAEFAAALKSVAEKPE